MLDPSKLCLRSRQLHFSSCKTVDSYLLVNQCSQPTADSYFRTLSARVFAERTPVASCSLLELVGGENGRDEPEKKEGDEKSIQSSEPKTTKSPKGGKAILGAGPLPRSTEEGWLCITKSSLPPPPHTQTQHLIKQFLTLTPLSFLPVNSAYSCEANTCMCWVSTQRAGVCSGQQSFPQIVRDNFGCQIPAPAPSPHVSS